MRDFNKVYERLCWTQYGNGSGIGSTLDETENIRSMISQFIVDNNVKVIVDTSVGGMAWWPFVLENHPKVTFYGYDISSVKIEENKKNFSHKKNWQFFTSDLVECISYPKSDLIICRHTLNHLTIDDIKSSLDNLINSNTRFIGLTTHPYQFIEYQIPIYQDTPGVLEYRPIDFSELNKNLGEPIIKIDDFKNEQSQNAYSCQFVIWKNQKIC